MPRPGHRPVRWRVGVGAGVLVLVGALSGCFGDKGPDIEPGGSHGGSSATEKPAPVTTETTVEKVSGHLNQGHESRMTDGVNAAIDQWIDGAFLGSFPRTDYTAAFAGFTKGARADAMKQLDLMSNRPLSDRIEQATAVHRRVRLDVLAPRGRPRGVTAHVVLDFATTGGVEEMMRVHGSLYLSKSLGHWHVFGYDVDQAVPLASDQSPSPSAAASSAGASS